MADQAKPPAHTSTGSSSSATKPLAQAAGKRPLTTATTEASKLPRVPIGTWSTAPIESAAPAPAATDELIAAAPKLAEAIRSAAKCVKVAEKVASLFEEGRVKLSNSAAVFEILQAAVEDPTRWRKPAMGPAFRRLLSAADARLPLFPLQRQQQIKVWKMRVATQIELLSHNPEHFANAFQELLKLLRRLPCDDPADEPRSSAQPGFSHLLTGARQDALPEHTRPTWCNAIFECLEVAVARFEGPHLWARAEVNTLIKLAAQRRRNFTRPQHEVLDKWESERRASPATRALEFAKYFQDKPVL